MPSKTTLKKNTQGYGYKYTDLAGIHSYLESVKLTYFQEVDETDHIVTHILDETGKELRAVRGAKIIETGALSGGKVNPAQDYGSSLTYARRYSLLLAFGLATDDDDAESLTGKTAVNRATPASSGGGNIDFAEVREKIAQAQSREDVENIYKTVPEKLRQYFTKDCEKRVKEIEENV